MAHRFSGRFARGLAIVSLLLVGIAWGTQARWRPIAGRYIPALSPADAQGDHPEDGGTSSHDEHSAGASHAESGHAHDDDAHSLKLSRQARKNIGLRVAKVQTRTFVRTIAIPGIVAERRGRTKTQVVAPLTGIVTRVHVMEGETVRSGQPLFDLRMTHEDLLQAQVEFLRIVEELDVVGRELERLRPLVDKGAIPERTLLERTYEQQKLEAGQRSQRQSLLLHGLSPGQVDEIVRVRALRSDLTVYVPRRSRGGGFGSITAASPSPNAPNQEPGASPIEGNSPPPDQSEESLFVAKELFVENGRLVTAGDELVSLADYSELYIEGHAFEQDGPLVAVAMRKGWPVSATAENRTPSAATVSDLSILYLSDEVDVASRTQHFYLPLKNELVRDETVEGHRFINWRFKPGQRMQLRVPVEQWPDRIVLPLDAVAQDGPEYYVFEQHGAHFDRRSVQVEFRDTESVVIAKDGSLSPGDKVVVSGAQQLLVALKQKGGGASDPHAGHQH
ncbi:MAG: efflux RND transporter periplasmic adaptor subunit [Planctomycetales bacterium]